MKIPAVYVLLLHCMRAITPAKCFFNWSPLGLAAIFCLALYPSIASPASTRGSLVEKIQAAYGTMTSMKASFSQVLVHKESGGRETRSGELLFKKPLLVRWETKTPERELLVVAPGNIWNVFPEEDLAYKYPPQMAEDSQSLVRVITGQARLEQDFTVESAAAEEGLAVLRLYPNEPTQALVEVVLWVDESSGLIQKFRVYDFYGNENEVVFSNRELNVTLPDSSFAYTPPPGMTVEDRSAQGAVQEPLLQ